MGGDKTSFSSIKFSLETAEVQRGYSNLTDSPPTKTLSPRAPGERVLVDNFPLTNGTRKHRKIVTAFPSTGQILGLVEAT